MSINDTGADCAACGNYHCQYLCAENVNPLNVNMMVTRLSLMNLFVMKRQNV